MTSKVRASALERLEHVFQDSSGGLVVPRDLRARAYRRASVALNGAADERAMTVALLGFAADLFAALAVELAARPAELRAVVDRLEALAEIPRIALGSEALRNPQLLQLPTAVAIEVQLALVLAYTRAEAVSLWTLWSDGNLKHIGRAGEFDAEARATRDLARKLLSEAKSQSWLSGRGAAGVVVERWQQPAAALIARGGDASSGDCAVLLEAAVPMLSATLERDELLGRGQRTEEEVVSATERRLSRLRFDLHDGPQQDLMLLAEDLRLLRSQLGSVMDGHGMRDRMVGRLDDLQARLIALDGDLRRISASLQSPFLQQEALPDALAQLTDAFASRTGIDPEVRLTGDLTRLTDSQQITLLGLIREALSNIREHSDANHVTVSISASSTGIEATVTDDGRGFEPEATLVKAARGGHLGLVGMHERVRLLGGRTQIDSRPGGPTVISATLPAMTAVAPRPG